MHTGTIGILARIAKKTLREGYVNVRVTSIAKSIARIAKKTLREGYVNVKVTST